MSKMSRGVCSYCGRPGPVLMDHYVPVCKGGTDDEDNLWPCCPSCNRSKNGRYLEQWRYIIARWFIGGDGFSPANIAFLGRHGFDLNALVTGATKDIRFFFEGGDGKVIEGFVNRRNNRCEAA